MPRTSSFCTMDQSNSGLGLFLFVAIIMVASCQADHDDGSTLIRRRNIAEMSTKMNATCSKSKLEYSYPMGTDFYDSLPIHVLSSDRETVTFQIQHSFGPSFGDVDIFVGIPKNLGHQCFEYEKVSAGTVISDPITAHCMQMASIAIVDIFLDGRDANGEAQEAIDSGIFKSSVCCSSRGEDNPPTKMYTFTVPCEMGCVADPLESEESLPPTAAPIYAETSRSLQEVIIQDMMPETSETCVPQAMNASYTFESSQSDSHWYEDFVDYERYVFLAKMQHQDNNSNRSWTVRLGQAGNIYSLVGAMGETVPPQRHENAPWIDEVWQAVTPLGNGGDNDQNPDTERYFIHEAGTYQRDGDNLKIPFYSPTVGKYCDGEKGECGFLSWGQQAHTPTPWKSPMLYLNRYVNCGDGVFEHTTMRHNNVGSPASYGYINVPWGGVRNSVLKDVVLSDKEAGHEVIYPLPGWQEGTTKNLGATLGYTMFAEDLPKFSPGHNTPYVALPAGLNLTVSGTCYDEGSHSARYVCPLVAQTVDVGYAPNRGEPGLMVRLEGRNEKSIVVGIRHWATGNRMYFYKNDDTAIADVLEAFPDGSSIAVYTWSPSSGKREEDNLALAHIHGGQNHSPSAGMPRVRIGASGRDYNVYTVNSNPRISAGDTYFYRQFFMLDSYNDMAARGPRWAQETLEETYSAGSRSARIINLYSSGSNRFGFTLESNDCAVLPPSPSLLVCQGSTTPTPDSRALFQIQCGETYVVTDDPYLLSPAGPPYRPYQCVNMVQGERPVWTLLGFFQVDGCSAISSGFVFDEQYCALSS